PDPERVLKIIHEHVAGEDAEIFVGVIDPIDPRVETADEVRERVLRAAEYVSPDQLGTCDDCGFSPFGDDTSTSRDIAFAKIAARVEGDRKSTRLNSSHVEISYAVFCLKKKTAEVRLEPGVPVQALGTTTDRAG